MMSSPCPESPCTSLCGGGVGTCADAGGMLTVVTIGTTQPARSSARRVKSRRRSASSASFWSVFALSSGRESSAIGGPTHLCLVPDARESGRAGLVDRFERESSTLGKHRQPAVAGQPLAVAVHEQVLEVSAQPLPQLSGTHLIDLEQPPGHENDQAVNGVGIDRNPLEHVAGDEIRCER